MLSDYEKELYCIFVKDRLRHIDKELEDAAWAQDQLAKLASTNRFIKLSDYQDMVANIKHLKEQRHSLMFKLLTRI